jgi:hypothetical protein
MIKFIIAGENSITKEEKYITFLKHVKSTFAKNKRFNDL